MLFLFFEQNYHFNIFLFSFAKNETNKSCESFGIRLQTLVFGITIKKQKRFLNYKIIQTLVLFVLISLAIDVAKTISVCKFQQKANLILKRINFNYS